MLAASLYLQGVLEIVTCSMSVVVFSIAVAGGGSREPIALLAMVGGALFSLLLLALAVLKIVAGYRCLSYRNRILGIVAGCSSVLSFFTCNCIPVFIAPFTLSLVVLTNDSVRRAFDFRAQGMSISEIRTRLHR